MKKIEMSSKIRTGGLEKNPKINKRGGGRLFGTLEYPDLNFVYSLQANKAVFVPKF